MQVPFQNIPPRNIQPATSTLSPPPRAPQHPPPQQVVHNVQYRSPQAIQQNQNIIRNNQGPSVPLRPPPVNININQ